MSTVPATRSRSRLPMAFAVICLAVGAGLAGALGPWWPATLPPQPPRNAVKLTDDDLPRLLQDEEKRQSLYLANSAVTDAGLEQLSRVKELQRLSLLGTAITDTGLAHLDGLPDLRDLDLGSTKVTDRGLAHLAQHKSLETLNLHRTQVTNAGVKYLKKLTHLQMVLLTGTKVTIAGRKELQEALPDLKMMPSADYPLPYPVVPPVRDPE